MDIYEKLQQILRRMREDGQTNQAIGDIAGISHAHANRLLNGPPDGIGSLKFDTAIHLFPDVRVAMERMCRECWGDASAQDNSVAEVVGTGRAKADHNSKATVNNPPIGARLDDALDAILDDASMCDACKMAAIRHIRDAVKRR